MTFTQDVYALVRKVPQGKVTTYKDIAHALGKGAYRSVGQALKRNPDAPNTPCHRVVASNGSIGGFFGETQGEPIRRKIALLNKEGIIVEHGMVKEFAKRHHTF